MRRLFFYLLIVLSVPLNIAADEYSAPELVAPKDNGLTAVSTESFCCDAKFTGQIWVSGVVSAQDSNGVDGDPGEPELILVPDANSLKQLPYFSRYEIKGIQITNYQEAVSMVFGKDMAKQIVARKVNNEKIKGRFLIKDYEVGIVCDFPFANAKLVSADAPPKLAVLGKHVMAYCG